MYLDLLPYCQTERQREYIHLFSQYRTIAEAAEASGVSERNCRAMLARIRKNKMHQDGSPPVNHQARDGMIVSGGSTLTDADGNVVLHWNKTKADDKRRLEMLEAAAEALSETIPRAKPVAHPKGKCNEELANVYVITDYHLGGNAWGEQTGADWDANIAEEMLLAYFKYAIKAAPKAETAVFAQIGDFLHWDGLQPLTPTAGHILDADTRYEKLVRIAIRVLRGVQHMLLKKYRRVHIIHAEGNHDLSGSVWLRELFAALYENEPRITVETSPDPYYCFEHGDTSLFFHHGHRKKLSQLDQVMAAKFRGVFGRTKHSYCHAGHLHHERSYESGLMITEQHRTLAAPDAYASSHGYMSGRSSPVITYHKRYGEVSRLNISPDMLREV